MKNLFGASFALASLAGSLLAIPAVHAAEPDVAIAPAAACSVESMDDVLRFHLKLDGVKGEAVHRKASIVTVTMTPASDGEVKFGWDIRTTETRRAAKQGASTVANPTISGKCVQGTHIKEAALASARAGNSASFTVVKTQSTTGAPTRVKTQSTTRSAMVTNNPNSNETSCALSGDPANPTLTVQLSGSDVGADGEVELYFMNDASAGSSCDISRGFTPRKNPA
jgi:hypothetical protein